MQLALNLAQSSCSDRDSALSLEVIILSNPSELAIYKDIANGMLDIENLLDFTGILDADSKWECQKVDKSSGKLEKDKWSQEQDIEGKKTNRSGGRQLH